MRREGEIDRHRHHPGQHACRLRLARLPEQGLEIAEVVIDQPERDPGPFGDARGRRLELALLEQAQQRISDRGAVRSLRALRGPASVTDTCASCHSMAPASSLSVEIVTVYLVGAGPGDPGLLTVRGAEVLARADVVVYDRLSVASLLDLAPAAARRINVGKSAGHATMPQEEIDQLLVAEGRAGGTVVRLKGGDPFVFARGERRHPPCSPPACPSRSCRASRRPSRCRPTPASR